MKTNEQIQAEDRQLIVLGNQYRDEHRTSTSAANTPAPRVLMQLPVSRTTTFHNADQESESVHTHLRERFIEATLARGELMYRLMEREVETTGSGRVVRDDAPSVVMSSGSGFDLLRTGYELIEEERLGELLVPYVERSEEPGRFDPSDTATVAEVESILETNLLSPAERLRTKAEIVEFLEGRLEPSVFITHAIDRQCAREDRRERRTERHEIRLTIDES